MSMISGESKPKEELKLVREGSKTAILPLAVPSIACPGAVPAAVLRTESVRFDPMVRIWTTIVLISVLIVAMLLVLATRRVQRLIGDSVASIRSRVWA